MTTYTTGLTNTRTSILLLSTLTGTHMPSSTSTAIPSMPTNGTVLVFTGATYTDAAAIDGDRVIDIVGGIVGVVFFIAMLLFVVVSVIMTVVYVSMR